MKRYKYEGKEIEVYNDEVVVKDHSWFWDGWGEVRGTTSSVKEARDLVDRLNNKDRK
ncbi:hypothetical protein [Bradyrhizobium sp.]